MPKNLFKRCKQWRNNKPTINVQSVKTQVEIDIGNTIEYDVKSCQVKNNYGKMYKTANKIIEV